MQPDVLSHSAPFALGQQPVKHPAWQAAFFSGGGAAYVRNKGLAVSWIDFGWRKKQSDGDGQGAANRRRTTLAVAVG
ncbi:hypothetical protein ACFQZE_21440 [Paenibacillus sp. GCM10027627]